MRGKCSTALRTQASRRWAVAGVKRVPGAYTSRVQLDRLGGPARFCQPAASSGKAMARLAVRVAVNLCQRREQAGGAGLRPYRQPAQTAVCRHWSMPL